MEEKIEENLSVSSSEIGLGQAIECMCMEGGLGNISNTYIEMLATGFGNSLWNLKDAT